MVKGRGARDRSGDNGSGKSADKSGGNSGQNGGGEARGDGQSRSAERRDASQSRDASRTAERYADNARSERSESGPTERIAVPRERDRGGYRDGSRVIVNQRPNNVYVNNGSPYRNYGSSYRGPRYYAPVHYHQWARSHYHWSPVPYVPWSLIYGSIGFSNFGFYGAVGSPYPYPYPYPYSYPYPGYAGAPYPPYSPWQPSGYDIGGVRLKIRPRDAQVFVDGHYAGLVDDFDGTFQALRLEAGGHKIEIRMAGYQDIELDVHVQPGRTITLQEDLRPRP